MKFVPTTLALTIPLILTCPVTEIMLRCSVESLLSQEYCPMAPPAIVSDAELL